MKNGFTMRQTLRGIQLFVAAYEELSFTLAANRENATQSGVSQHVGDLEETCASSNGLRQMG
jgi:hypothetical protein